MKFFFGGGGGREVALSDIAAYYYAALLVAMMQWWNALNNFCWHMEQIGTLIPLSECALVLGDI